MDIEPANPEQTKAMQLWEDLQNGRTDEAIAWAESLPQASADPEVIGIAAKILARSGKLELAKMHYEHMHSLDPGDEDISFALACCNAELGNADTSLEMFQQSIANPAISQCVALAKALEAGAHKDAALSFLASCSDKDAPPAELTILQASMLGNWGRSEDAIAELRKALDRGIDDANLCAQAWFNLGVLLQSDRSEEAENAYRNAIASDATYSAAWTNLSALLIDHSSGNMEQALHVLTEARQKFPELVSLMYLRAFAYHTDGKPELAVGELSQLVQLTRDHPQGWELMGRSLVALDRVDEAIKHYQSWLDCHPRHPVASHMLAALQGAEAPDRASQEYVAYTFDAFAHTFDDLLAKLGYQGPALFEELLKKYFDQTQVHRLNILDAGCGTGQMGRVLRSYAESLDGVDLSAGMLEYARRTEVYDRLVNQDVVEYLENCDSSYDLIIASDMFNYFGDLSQLLKLCLKVLKQDGMLMFSVEQGPLSDDCYTLMPHGRYIHSPHYLIWLLGEQGITGGTMRKVVLRKEEQQDVNALLVVAQRPPQET